MMRAVLDACVLYPSVMREVLLGVAAEGLFEPLWSDRILEEWARVAERAGAGQGIVARGEIVRLGQRWPGAKVVADDAVAAGLWLPDSDDIHVLACAVTGQATLIITLNLRDFPKRELEGHGLRAVHPDAFLMECWLKAPEAVERAVSLVQAEAARMDGAPKDLRQLLKRAGLPRLGKALG